MSIRVPIGYELFDEIRENGNYYVDKTELIYELLNNTQDKVVLITRPRRFGKTLNMNMIRSFLDINRDSRKYFEGLAVTKHEEFCNQWMNQYPVVFMTLKDVADLRFETAYAMLKTLISDVCKNNRYLLNDTRTDPEDRTKFQRLLSGEANRDEINNFVAVLMRMMKAVHGKNGILIIDEYDVPLAKARENGHYEQMLNVIRGFLSKSLKSNDYLQFAVITGCLRIAKESIFTGVNNFKSYSVLDPRLSQYFGFTQPEMDKMLQDGNLTDKADVIREWYDGYIFGNSAVYCPWDVVNYVADVSYDPNQRPKNYWKNTSGNAIIREFVEDEKFQVNDKFETLMNGGTITQTISDELTYDTLKMTEDNLWSVLLMTGYLTKADPNENSETVRLKIPNKEIEKIFEETVVRFFADTLSTDTLNELMNALWNGDETKASEIFSNLLFDTISYMDYHEDYYHAFLAGLFVGRGYGVDSNKEHGLGRPDIVIKDRRNRRAIVIEAKKSASEDRMEKDCETALTQIQEMEYNKNLKGYRQIMSYGIAFFEKDALVRKL